MHSQSQPISTPYSPTASELEFLLSISTQLAGPLDLCEAIACCQTFCRYFNLSQLHFGETLKDQRKLISYLAVRGKAAIDNQVNEVSPKLTPKTWQLLAGETGFLCTLTDHNTLYNFLNLNKTNQRPLLVSPYTRNSRNDHHYFISVCAKANNASVLDSDFFVECLQILCGALINHHDNRLRQDNIQHLNAVIDTSDSVYATWHAKVGWGYLNTNGFEKLGFVKDKIDVSSMQENNPMHPEDWQASLVHFKNMVEKGISYAHDYRSNPIAGEERWYHANSTLAEPNKYGGAKLMTSISRDITAIKRAQLEAEDNLKREKRLTEITHQICSAYDFKGLQPALQSIGNYLNASRCVVRMVDPETKLVNLVAEWHREDQVSMRALFPEMTSQTGIGWIERLINLGSVYAVNSISRDVPNKKLRDYHAAINTDATLTQPIISNKQLIGYLAVLNVEARDWTDSEIRFTKVLADTLHMAISRNRLLDDLHAAEERIRLAMQNSTYSLWDYNIKAGTLFLSPQFFTALGYQPNSFSNNPREFNDLIHPEDREKLASLYQSQQSYQNNEITIELRFRRKDGSYSWILSRGKAVAFDDDGKPIQRMGVNIEINDLKETQQELRIARERAEEANRSKSEFLERMSHEIRTPMNAILGMSYLTLDSDLSREQRNHLEDIENAAKSLLHVIDDILDFSKIESGELNIIAERFDLHAAINKLVKLYRSRAQQANNNIELVIAEDIPRFVVGDPNRMGQVITNLVSNAIKFTQDGLISLSVQLAEVNNKNSSISILFSVSDSGIGLTEAQLQTLFQPFTQAEGSTTRKYGGSGLGLSICKHLVEMMGGSIHAISLPGVGTTFHFTIVFEQVEQITNFDEHTPLLASSSISNNITLQFVDKHVLLTEDNLVNQRVAMGILKKFGVQVTTANNGQEALDILHAAKLNTFDAILMDIEMPVLDGLAAAKRVRSQPQFAQLPIIAMTAHAMVGDRERCLAVGMNEHIPKPINPQVLFNVLAQMWDKSSDDVKGKTGTS